MKSGFNYMYIVNPETGRKVQTNGILGKKILNKYVTYLSGGAGPKAVAAARRSAARRSAARRSSPAVRRAAEESSLNAKNRLYNPVELVLPTTENEGASGGGERFKDITDWPKKWRAISDQVAAQSGADVSSSLAVRRAAEEADVNRLWRHYHPETIGGEPPYDWVPPAHQPGTSIEDFEERLANLKE